MSGRSQSLHYLSESQHKLSSGANSKRNAFASQEPCDMALETSTDDSKVHRG